MICPNLNDKTVKQQFTELVNAVGEVAAYDIWNQNNGNAIDKAPNGAESKLFSDLLNYYNGDRNSAIKAKAQVYSKSFKSWFGDWLNSSEDSSKITDKNSEPLLVYHHSNDSITEFSTEFNNYFSRSKGGTKEAIFFTRTRYPKSGTVLDRKYSYPVYLSAKNVIEKTGTKDELRTTGEDFVSTINRSSKEADAAIFHGIDDNQELNQDIYVVHRPNQIKSIDNQGSFSREDNNIYRAEYTDTTVPSDPDLRNRLFNGKDEASIGVMLTRLAKSSPALVPFINKVKANIPVNVKARKVVLIPYSEDNPSHAWYDTDNGIVYISENAAYEHNGKLSKADNTIFHEILHAATVSVLNNSPELKGELKSIMDNVKQYIGSDYYGMKDEYEFLAELWSNAKFAKELMNIPASKKQSMLDKIIDWLMKAFGITNSDNAFVEAHNFMVNMLTNYQDLNYNLEDINKELSTANLHLAKPIKQTNNPVTIKNIFDQQSKHIAFDADTHTYTNTETGEVYKSVSDVKKLAGFAEDIDTMTQQQLIYGDFTARVGTAIHEVLSKLMKGEPIGDTQFSPRVIKQLTNIANIVKRNGQVIASEQVISNDDAKVAGTLDLLVRDKRGKIKLLDFKTKMRNYGDKKKYGFTYYNKTKYSNRPDRDRHMFQLAMYQYMQEQLGIHIDERGVIPIEVDVDKEGNVTNVYFSNVLVNEENQNELTGVYKMPIRSDVDLAAKKSLGLLGENNQLSKLNEQQLKQTSEIVNKILKTLSNKTILLSSKGRDIESRILKNKVKEFQDATEQEIMVGYINTALSSLEKEIQRYNTLLDREKEEGQAVWNLTTLEIWKDLAESFEPLRDLRNYLYDYKDFLSKDEQAEVLKALDTAITYKDVLEKAYDVKGKPLWIQWLQPFVGIIRGRYKREAEIQYKKDNKGRKINKDDMQAYIDKYINDNAEKIQTETYNFIEQQSRIADSDTNAFYRYTDTIFQSQDPIISAMAKAYDEVVSQTRVQYVDKYRQLADLTKELHKALGVTIASDPKKVYDFMIEYTSSGPRLIKQMPSSFDDAYLEAKEEIDKDPKYILPEQRSEALRAWLNKNAPIVDKERLNRAKLDLFDKMLQEDDITEEEHKILVENEKSKNRRKGVYTLASESKISRQAAELVQQEMSKLIWQYRKIDPKLYPNTKWDNLSKLRKTNPDDIRIRFYDFIYSLSEEGDAGVAKRYKLNGRLPGVSLDMMERVKSGQNIAKAALRDAKRQVIRNEDDTHLGSFALSDELDRPIDFVPVFYTARLEEQDQSYDIPSIYNKWFASALNYYNTTKVMAQLEFTRHVVNSRRTKITDSKGRAIKNYLEKKFLDENPNSSINASDVVKDTSNLADQLNDWFQQVIYQKSDADLGIIMGVDAAKLVDLLSKYTSLSIMGVNYISMVNNVLMAETQQAIESFANRYVSAKAYTKATGEYAKDLPNILGDIGATKATSKVNLLNEHFGVFTDYTEGDFQNKLRFTRLFNTSALYATNNLGEHEAQSRFLIASLINKEAKDRNGNVIGSVYDYFYVEDGKLKFDKDGVVANFSPDEQNQFSARVRALLMQMHGNYAPHTKVALQRWGLTRLALMFRKWIIPGIRRRYSTEYYDNVIDDWQEGYYRTGARFIKNKVGSFFMKYKDEARALEMASSADWSTMTEFEKYNVKRFAIDAAFLTAAIILTAVLTKLKDDDDDEDMKIFWSNMAYQTYRLKTDIAFFFNPADALKIVQSPIPSSSLIKSFTNFIGQIIKDPTEKYVRGEWEDHYKLEKQFFDLLPIARQLYRYQDIANEMTLLQSK